MANNVESQSLNEMKMPKVCGFNILVRMHIIEKNHYIRDANGNVKTDVNGNSLKIIVPPAAIVESGYMTCAGQVVAMGDDCFKKDKIFSGEPWCKVGDWIVFPRNEGSRIEYKGVLMMLLPDYSVNMVIDDPKDVIRG